MGKILQIQRFSTDDGPGIRTTVFIKGCPLHCAWCHNPESQRFHAEIAYNAYSCIGCGACVSACDLNCHKIMNDEHCYIRDDCAQCGKCADACIGALKVIGEEYNPNEVMGILLMDNEFYRNSGGGITISGGEPLAASKFVKEILILCKKNKLHTCIETSGYAKWNDILEILPFVDLFLFDWKLTNPNLHRKYTGVSNEIIKENLINLDGMGGCIILRCPIIPGVNDNEEHFEGICKLAEQLKNIQHIELMPYHPLGASKSSRYGYNTQQEFVQPRDEEIQQWLEWFKVHTRIVVKRG